QKDGITKPQPPACELCPTRPADDIRSLHRWSIGYAGRSSEVVPIMTLREERWTMRFSLVLRAFIGARAPCPGIARADALLHQLAEERSWVRFDAHYFHRESFGHPLIAPLT